MLLVLTLCAGCTQADKDAINAAMWPVRAAWEEQQAADPLAGIAAGADMFVQGEQIRSLRRASDRLAY